MNDKEIFKKHYGDGHTVDAMDKIHIKQMLREARYDGDENGRKKGYKFGVKIGREQVDKKWCGSERPVRKTLCQRKKGHKGSCNAVIFWEDEKSG